MHREIFSQDKTHKAVITARTDGLYEVQYLRLTKDVVPELNFESDYFWEAYSRPSLTDTLETAEKLAREELKLDNP